MNGDRDDEPFGHEVEPEASQAEDEDDVWAGSDLSQTERIQRIWRRPASSLLVEDHDEDTEGEGDTGDDDIEDDDELVVRPLAASEDDQWADILLEVKIRYAVEPSEAIEKIDEWCRDMEARAAELEWDPELIAEEISVEYGWPEADDHWRRMTGNLL
jgi:hypothetical protein